MQQRRNGKKLMLIGGVIIILVLGAAFLLTSLGGGSSSGTHPTNGGSVAAVQPSSSTVVVAAAAIPQGTVLHSGQALDTFFTTKAVPANLVPQGAYTHISQILSVLDSSRQITATQTIFQGAPVVSGMFSQLGQYRTVAGPSFTIPAGFVGIAINLDPVNSVLGSIAAGDNIDLMASYHGKRVAGLTAPAQTQYVMNDLRVLSVNVPSTTPASGTGTAAAAPATAGNGGSILLLARYQQALVIQHLKDFGWQMSAVLRAANASQTRTLNTVPVTERWFFVKTANPFKTNPGY